MYCNAFQGLQNIAQQRANMIEQFRPIMAKNERLHDENRALTYKVNVLEGKVKGKNAVHTSGISACVENLHYCLLRCRARGRRSAEGAGIDTRPAAY